MEESSENIFLVSEVTSEKSTWLEADNALRVARKSFKEQKARVKFASELLDTEIFRMATVSAEFDVAIQKESECYLAYKKSLDGSRIKE